MAFLRKLVNRILRRKPKQQDGKPPKVNQIFVKVEDGIIQFPKLF